MRVKSMSSVIIDLKIQQQCHVTVSPNEYLQFPLQKKIPTQKMQANNKKKHKNPKAPFARHHAIIQAAPQIVSYFSETHTFPTPKTKKNSRLLPWPIGCQTLPHRPPDIMMPQRQKCPPRSTQRHRVRVRGSVDPPRPPDTSGADLMDGLNGGTGIVFFFVRRGTTTTAKLDHKKKNRTFGVVVFFVALVVLSARVHILSSVIFSYQIEQSSMNGTCSINDQGSLPTNTKSDPST